MFSIVKSALYNQHGREEGGTNACELQLTMLAGSAASKRHREGPGVSVPYPACKQAHARCWTLETEVTLVTAWQRHIVLWNFKATSHTSSAKSACFQSPTIDRLNIHRLFRPTALQMRI